MKVDKEALISTLNPFSSEYKGVLVDLLRVGEMGMLTFILLVVGNELGGCMAPAILSGVATALCLLMRYAVAPDHSVVEKPRWQKRK